MFTIQELYLIKGYLYDLQQDYDHFNEVCCEEAPYVAIDALHEDRMRLRNLFLKVCKIIDQIDPDLPFKEV